MVYCDFSNSLYKYLDIYHNGLKKLANKEMQAIVGHLREMSDENQDEILTQFLSLKEKTVSERLINQLNYYRILYECYNRYVDDGRKRKFEDYLNEANIHFLYSRAFYYEK